MGLYKGKKKRSLQRSLRNVVSIGAFKIDYRTGCHTEGKGVEKEMDTDFTFVPPGTETCTSTSVPTVFLFYFPPTREYDSSEVWSGPEE